LDPTRIIAAVGASRNDKRGNYANRKLRLDALYHVCDLS
jgi:hypothetical protein